uniref:Cathepsin propeptide inhibitor domain-containing protein n=1 Tax=Oryza punctata TaxID=4537 RepID=A0A0E0JTX3_ORYPU
MRVSAAALMTASAAAAAALLLLIWTISYEEQETRRMFVEWKGKYGKTYKDVGEEECRYAVFKDTHRRRIDRYNAAAAAAFP